MHVLTTAPCPHRYCTSPIRVLARLSRRLTVTGSGEKTLSETRRGPRGGSQSWFAVGVASRYRGTGRAGLQRDARDFDCDLWVKGFKKLPYHFVAFGGKPTHPLTHPMRVMRPSQNLEHENAKRSCARRDRAAAADFPSSVRFLKRASRQPYLRSHIWIHSVVADSSCLATPLL
jgi:hypothetical protein